MKPKNRINENLSMKGQNSANKNYHITNNAYRYYEQGSATIMPRMEDSISSFLLQQNDGNAFLESRNKGIDQVFQVKSRMLSDLQVTPLWESSYISPKINSHKFAQKVPQTVPQAFNIQQYNRNILENLYTQSKSQSKQYEKDRQNQHHLKFLCQDHNSKYEFVCLKCKLPMCRYCHCIVETEVDVANDQQIGRQLQMPKGHKIIKVKTFLKSIEQQHQRNKKTIKIEQLQQKVEYVKQKLVLKKKYLQERLQKNKQKVNQFIQKLYLQSRKFQALFRQFIKQLENQLRIQIDQLITQVKQRNVIQYVLDAYKQQKRQNGALQVLIGNWQPLFQPYINRIYHRSKYRINIRNNKQSLKTQRKIEQLNKDYNFNIDKKLKKYTQDIETDERCSRVLCVEKFIENIGQQLEKIQNELNNSNKPQDKKQMSKSAILFTPNGNRTSRHSLTPSQFSELGLLSQKARSKSRQKITQNYTLTQVKNNIRRQSMASLSPKASLANSINRIIISHQKDKKFKKICNVRKIKNQVQCVSIYGGTAMCELIELYHPWKIGNNHCSNSITYNQNTPKKQFPPHKGFGFLKLKPITLASQVSAQKQNKVQKLVSKSARSKQKIISNKKQKQREKFQFIVIGGYLNQEINQCIFRVSCQKKKKQLIGRMAQGLAYFGFSTKCLTNQYGKSSYLVYLCGGLNSFDEAVSNLICYEFSQIPTLTHRYELPSMDQPRHSLSLAQHRQSFYAIGGIDNENRVLKTVTKYCIKARTWSHDSDLCYQRAYHSCVSLPTGLYVIGGWNGQNYLRSVQKYDEIRQKFTIIMDMKQARASFGIMSCPQTDAIIILGGKNNEQLSTCQYLSIKNKSSCFLKGLKKGRSDFYCF